MIAFESMLEGPAKEAGIKVPDDLENYCFAEYAHWFVYCAVQLGESLPYPYAHWDNAKLIAAITDEKIKTVTYEDLCNAGLAVGNC